MVYFIEAHGLVKIGHAVDAEKRLADLQRFSPVKLRMVALWMEGTEPDERKLHRDLREWRSHGEWFKLTGTPVLEAIDAHRLPRPIIRFSRWESKTGRKLNLSPEQRQARRDAINKRIEEGRVGGQFGKLGGRPKKVQIAP